MFAELLARSGNTLLNGVAPDGRNYWANRFWDRDGAEEHPLLRERFLDQKDTVAKMIGEYGAEVDQVLEFCCGTGEFTRIAAERTTARTITALDISAQGLERARARVDHDDARFVRGDFWADNGLAPAELVVCIDAIHHLGNLEDVLRRLRSFVKPDGIMIGNLWTADHFHEFERIRYGRVNHLGRTAAFFGTAAMIRFSGGRLKAGAYRTQLRQSADAIAVLNKLFDEVLVVDKQRYFTSFACRR